VLRAADMAAAGADHFENPQDWIDEIGRDVRGAERRSPGKAAPAAKSEPARPAGGATAVAATPAARGGTPSLVFVRGTHAGQSIALLPTTLTIGREHDNNIEIKDAEVGRYHARIIHERGRYVLEDLDSSTGTWINGQRTRRAVLNQGDVIRVGQTELAFDAEWTSGSR
jgi:pSer/pThr/pTyr-binding forkhead associated (FHA) protein